MEFFLWLHCESPQIREDIKYGTLIKLAIFAETYQIYHLINQTSDVLQDKFRYDT